MRVLLVTSAQTIFPTYFQFSKLVLLIVVFGATSSQNFKHPVSDTICSVLSHFFSRAKSTQTVNSLFRTRLT